MSKIVPHKTNLHSPEYTVAHEEGIEPSINAAHLNADYARGNKILIVGPLEKVRGVAAAWEVCVRQAQRAEASARHL